LFCRRIHANGRWDGVSQGVADLALETCVRVDAANVGGGRMPRTRSANASLAVAMPLFSAPMIYRTALISRKRHGGFGSRFWAPRSGFGPSAFLLIKGLSLAFQSAQPIVSKCQCTLETKSWKSSWFNFHNMGSQQWPEQVAVVNAMRVESKAVLRRRHFRFISTSCTRPRNVWERILELHRGSGFRCASAAPVASHECR
jgi:hypothetical protein